MAHILWRDNIALDDIILMNVKDRAAAEKKCEQDERKIIFHVEYPFQLPAIVMEFLHLGNGFVEDN